MSSTSNKKPDSIVAQYLDELLSADDQGSPWADEDSPDAGSASDAPGAAPSSAAGSRRKRAGARRPQSAPVRVADRPAPDSTLVSPSLRQLASEPDHDTPETAQIAPEASKEVPQALQEPRETTQEPTETAQAPEAPADSQGLADAEPAPAPVTAEAPVEERSKATIVDDAPAEPAPIVEPEPWQQGRPPWAQEGFECLIFRVAGLQLAVPLVLLGQIHRLDRELTPLVGRPDWFMGLLRVGEQNVRVTDTALWVMPDRYRPEFRDGYRFVIQLGDSAWGLACDEVAQSFRVQPDEVKWRSQGGRRQWLAGTIRKEMCALLDVSRLADLLEKAETQRRPELDR